MGKGGIFTPAESVWCFFVITIVTPRKRNEQPNPQNARSFWGKVRDVSFVNEMIFGFQPFAVVFGVGKLKPQRRLVGSYPPCSSVQDGPKIQFQMRNK